MHKSIIKTFLTPNHCFWLKYKSSLYNIVSPSKKEKVILSESGEKYAQIKHHLGAQSVQNCSTLVDFDVMKQQGMDFFTVGSVIMDNGLVFWPEVMV